MTICLQDRGERQRLARIKKRAANMANCRTLKCLALDTVSMEEALDVTKDRPKSLPDRIFLTLFTPLPCHACEKLRNMGEGLLLSCQCTFQQLRGPDATYTSDKRPTCHICRRVRYYKGVFLNCACTAICREYCKSAGLWKYVLQHNFDCTYLVDIPNFFQGLFWWPCCWETPCTNQVFKPPHHWV